MEKVKNFIKNNKKIVIPVAVLLVLLLVVGIYFTSQPSVESDKRGDRYTEEKIEISKEESKTEDQKRTRAKEKLPVILLPRILTVATLTV